MKTQKLKAELLAALLEMIPNLTSCEKIILHGLQAELYEEQEKKRITLEGFPQK